MPNFIAGTDHLFSLTSLFQRIGYLFIYLFFSFSLERLERSTLARHIIPLPYLAMYLYLLL